MRHYDLVETPKTGKTFLEDGENRILASDERVSVYFQSIDKVKYDRAFDEEGYPILKEYALKEDGTRYQYYLAEPDEKGVYQPDEVAIQDNEQTTIQLEQKNERLRLLAELTVETTNGNIFDANDVARQDMLSAIDASTTLGISENNWKLADNSWALIQLDELKEASALAIQAKGAILASA